MNVATVVGVVEGGAYLFEERGHVVRMERPLLLDDLLQRLPRDVLHDDEGGTVFFPHVVDVHDVRMGEAGGRLRLALEAGAEVWVSRELGAKCLDGNLTVQQEVAAEVDLGHAPVPDLSLHLVALVNCRPIHHPHRPNRRDGPRDRVSSPLSSLITFAARPGGPRERGGRARLRASMTPLG